MVNGPIGGLKVKIIVNKEAMTLPENSTVTELLEHINSSKSVAVFINGKQLLLAEYDHHIIKENDDIKIIRPLGGG